MKTSKPSLATLLSRETQDDNEFSNPRMSYETLRLKTFETFSCDNKPFVIKLAKAGFYYAGSGDEAVCYCCDIRVSDWKDTDDPITRHKERSPDCPFLLNNPDVNIAVTDVSGSLASQADSNNQELSKNCLNPTTGLYSHLHVHGFEEGTKTPEGMHSREIRHESFRNAPSVKPFISRLVNAGFFHSGRDDEVICAFCRLRISNWTQDDDPREVHQHFSPCCVFLTRPDGIVERIENLTDLSDFPQNFQHQCPSETTNTQNTEQSECTAESLTQHKSVSLEPLREGVNITTMDVPSQSGDDSAVRVGTAPETGHFLSSAMKAMAPFEVQRTEDTESIFDDDHYNGSPTRHWSNISSTSTSLEKSTVTSSEQNGLSESLLTSSDEINESLSRMSLTSLLKSTDENFIPVTSENTLVKTVTANNNHSIIDTTNIPPMPANQSWTGNPYDKDDHSDTLVEARNCKMTNGFSHDAHFNSFNQGLVRTLPGNNNTRADRSHKDSANNNIGFPEDEDISCQTLCSDYNQSPEESEYFVETEASTPLTDQANLSICESPLSTNTSSQCFSSSISQSGIPAAMLNSEISSHMYSPSVTAIPNSEISSHMYSPSVTATATCPTYLSSQNVNSIQTSAQERRTAIRTSILKPMSATASASLSGTTVSASASTEAFLPSSGMTFSSTLSASASICYTPSSSNLFTAGGASAAASAGTVTATATINSKTDEQPHTSTRAEKSVRKGKNQKTKGEKRNGGNQRRRRPER